MNMSPRAEKRRNTGTTRTGQVLQANRSMYKLYNNQIHSCLALELWAFTRVRPANLVALLLAVPQLRPLLSPGRHQLHSIGSYEQIHGFSLFLLTTTDAVQQRQT